MTGLALLAAAAVLLAAGAELFAEHAAAAGRRLGVTALAIGLVLAGAEPEELVTAVVASLRHRPGIAVGDALGANVTMLTLVLGLAAVARPLPVGPRVRRYALGASVAGALAALALAGGRVSRAEGALLLGLYVVVVAVVWVTERRPPAVGEAAELLDAGDGLSEGAGLGRGLALALAGVAVMAAGGRVAVAGAERAVTDFGLGDSAVGLTLVALATTAELFALAWAAARRGVSELAVAGVVGSALYNATATLGAAALVRPVRVGGVGGAALAAAGLPLVVVVLAARRARIGRGAGVALLAGYVVYLAWVLG